MLSIPRTVQGADVLPAWQRAVTAQGGHPTTVSNTTRQRVQGTETLWPWGCMARECRGCGHLARLCLSFSWTFSLHGCAGKLLQQGAKNPLWSESLQNGYIFWSSPWDACPHGKPC